MYIGMYSDTHKEQQIEKNLTRSQQNGWYQYCENIDKAAGHQLAKRECPQLLLF